MRLIDADKLVSVTLTDGGYWTKEVYYKADIDAAPTAYPPPNEPLTQEQLREMEGEPVWLRGNGLNRWYIFDGFSLDGIAFFTPEIGYGKMWAGLPPQAGGGGNMILYHFCPAHMKNAILTEGLTKGCFPLMESGGFVRNVQWLTSERDPKMQTWATRNLIAYSRTAYRLTVHIPDSRHKKLMKARDWVTVFPEGDRGIVTELPGSEAWFVYMGKIPQKWIVGCRRMEEAT